MCGFFSSSLASSSEESAWGRCFFTGAFFAGAFFATAACFVVFFIVRTRITHCCQFSLTSLAYLVELGTKVPIQKNCLETHYRSTLLTFFFAGTAFKVPLLTTPDFEERESVIFCQSLFERILVRRERNGNIRLYDKREFKLGETAGRGRRALRVCVK